jgi:PAS domain S-box-containing protein
MPPNHDERTKSGVPDRVADEFEQVVTALKAAREEVAAVARERDAARAESRALRTALAEERAQVGRRIAEGDEVGAGTEASAVKERASGAAARDLLVTVGELKAASTALSSASMSGEAILGARTAEAVEVRAGLRQSEERLRVVLDSAADYAIFAMDLGRHVVSWNAGAERVLGWTQDEIMGQRADIMFTPEDRAAGAPEAEAERALAEDRAVDERWHLRKDGTRFWGSGLTMPLHDAAAPGEPPAGLVKVMRDQTERRRVEDALRESEARWRGVFQHMHEGFALCEMVPNPKVEATDFRYLEINDAWERLTGIPAAATVGRLASEVFPGIEDFWLRTYRQVVETGKAARFEHNLGPVQRWFEVLAYRTEPGRFAALFLDVTERKRAEERRMLLVNELNQRVKNTLAVVQSIAAQTARGAVDLPSFSTAFQARLLVLASAHDLLTRADWEGATLDAVVKAGLDPLALDDVRVDLSGCAAGIMLPPAAALALTIAVHELATNALKHGALSVVAGRVSISCRAASAEHAVPVVEWVECGGPTLGGPPERKGFGLRLLGRGLTAEAGMAADLRFEPEGLRCTLRLPQVLTDLPAAET